MIKHIILNLIILALLIWRIVAAFVVSQHESFPSQPIQIVVPYLAGGGSDTFARIFEKALSKNENLGVPIVIVNRPGGSATIGSRFVKDSRPDGYRILCHHEGIIATKLAGTVPFGPEAFEPVAQTASKILLMIVRADSPYRSLPDLLDAAQQNPNTIRIGANQGSPAWFLCQQMLLEYPGADFNFIPADGSKRISYLLGNKLEAGVFSLDEYMANRNSDSTPPEQNILAIANFSQIRHPDIPDVSTSLEQGLQTHAENSYYFWAPRGTPSQIVDRLAVAFKTAIEDPQVIEDLNRLSIPPSFRSGQALQHHLASRVRAFDRIAVRAETDLPNFAAWLIGIVGVLLVGVVTENFLIVHDSSPTQTTRFNLTGWICLGLLCGYVALLQLHVPYVIATAAFIFLMGGTISGWKFSRMLSIIQIALLFSVGTEFVFTRLFSVPLP
jgi:tripartite-type tricarboxylate transporter receptor subunit TctC